MRIPRIIHQIWIGTKDVPTDFLSYQKTWTNMHQSWEYILWGNENIKKLKYFDLAEYNQLANWSEKSDYLRIIILLEYGGIYADIDFECLQPLDNLIRKIEFFIWKDSWWKTINTAIIGSTKNNRIIKLIYRGFSNQISKFSKDHDFNKIWPFYVNKIIKGIKLSDNEKIFNEKVFYPIEGALYYKWIKIDRQNLIKKWSFGIHHYTYSWSKLLYIKRKYLYKYKLLRFILEQITAVKQKIWKYLK